MKDREIVRMAYRLILGREPESDTVLDRVFEDIYELREGFINSNEFSSLFSKVPIIDNGKLQIIYVDDPPPTHILINTTHYTQSFFLGCTQYGR